ncbi:MAG: N-acetylglucosamine-6-phosphate deacetylase [Cellulosilyticum sp.]|nr:N-acetylglucosamine-6-phosphate deacetylase [Cellulosilyticum sp.]
MQILNGHVYLDTFQFKKTHLLIKGPYIDALTDTRPFTDYSPPFIDATDCYVIPGLIDIHLHGACGYDFCDATYEALSNIATYELKNGITTIFPTTMTLPFEETCHILKAITKYHQNSNPLGSSIGGVHLEGPYISANQCGAQDASACRSPHLEEFKQLQKVANGLIRYVTLAPELEGAFPFIQALSNEIILSQGHTCADYTTSLTALQLGCRHLTHCYNAMPPLHHREPGVIGAAIDYGKAYIELICDGLHLHPAMIRQSFKFFDSDHIILVSDSTMATGLSDGDYTLGGSPIKVKKGEARTLQGNLAGSTTHLMDCLRQAVSFGIPLEIALKCVTANPAREAGLYHQIGSILPGKYADCVILNQNLEIIHVIKHGQLIL